MFCYCAWQIPEILLLEETLEVIFLWKIWKKKKNVFCSPIISPREIGLENSRGKELKVAGSNIAIHTL